MCVQVYKGISKVSTFLSVFSGLLFQDDKEKIGPSNNNTKNETTNVGIA